MPKEHHRELTLQSELSPRAYHKTRQVPSLKLSGVWLEEAGFKSGTTVQVTVKEKELIIRPLDNENS